MSVTARVALRASLRPQRAARMGVAPIRSRMASTQAQSAAVSNTGRLSIIAAVAVAGTAIGAFAYNNKAPLRMESNGEQSKRKSYSERSKPKIQRAQMTGGPSSSETQGARESEKQEESTRKPEPVNVTSYSGNTTGQQTEERRNKKNEEKEGDRQQKQDNARQSVADSNTLPLDELENEASQESAFDPETNTINWDCPCLGGMAHGPCGDEFKEAFSCFVFSEKEPKGIECVEKFKGMQDCFRKYPEHYKEELEDDEGFESHEGETLEKKGEEHLSSKSGDDDDDEGVKEWRSELAKEGKQ